MTAASVVDSLGSYDLSKIAVLVVEDNRPMAKLVRQVLGALNIRNVSLASDGSEAFRTLRTFAADVVIVDWEMWPLDGLDFLRLVRRASDSPCPEIPVLMLTGYTEKARVEQARDAGVNEYIAKPLTAAALYRRLVLLVTRNPAFVRSAAYVGPDRRRPGAARRSVSSAYDGAERRGRAGRRADDGYSDGPVVVAGNEVASHA